MTMTSEITDKNEFDEEQPLQSEEKQPMPKFPGESQKVSSKGLECKKIMNKRLCNESEQCIWEGSANEGRCLNKVRAEIITVAENLPIKKIAEQIEKQAEQEIDDEDIEFQSVDEDEDDDEFQSVDDEFKSVDDDNDDDDDQFQSVDDDAVTLWYEASKLEHEVQDSNGENDKKNAEYISALTEVALDPVILHTVYDFLQQTFTTIPGGIMTTLKVLVELMKKAYDEGAAMVVRIREFADHVNELITGMLEDAEKAILSFYSKVEQWMEKAKPFLRGANVLTTLLIKLIVLLMRFIYASVKVTAVLSWETSKFIFRLVRYFANLNRQPAPASLENYEADESFLQQYLSTRERRRSVEEDDVMEAKPYLRQRDNLLVELTRDANQWLIKGGHAPIAETIPVGLHKGEIFKKGYMGGAKKKR
jgi:hypothetical protein